MTRLHQLALLVPAFALAAGPALAAEKPPVSLPKVGKWEINYDEDSCSLFAKFGAGDDTAILSLTQTSPGDWLEMKVFGKMLKYGGIEMPVEVAFGSQAKPYKRTAIAVTAGGKEKLPAMIVQGLRIDGWDFSAKSSGPVAAPKVTPEVAAGVGSITFRAAGGKRYRLETGSLAAPMAAMRTCTTDLLQHWGFDPAVHAGLSKPTTPINNPASWLGTGDFPNKALMRGSNGLVRFRLDVEADGKVSRCRVLYRTNPDEFADLSCKLLLQRAKMAPALDASGKPVRSFYVSQVRWQAGVW